jgi:hypothetical protein
MELLKSLICVLTAGCVVADSVCQAETMSSKAEFIYPKIVESLCLTMPSILVVSFVGPQYIVLKAEVTS